MLLVALLAVGKNLLTAGHTFGLCGDKVNDGTTAIWIGSTLSANTPFRVTYDGTVYMKKLVCQNESGGTQTVDVTQINFKPATSVALSGATLGSKAHLYNGILINSRPFCLQVFIFKCSP